MRSSPDPAPRFEPRRPRRARPRWRQARRHLAALMESPDDTRRALDVMHALDPGAAQRDFARLLARPAGRRLYEERPSLREAVRPERLRSLPEGSLGRALLEHLERWELDAEKLVALNLDHARAAAADPGFAWWLERSILLHDLWHVLAGYGADDLGEAALLPFSWAQQGGLGRGFLTIGSVLRAWEQGGRRWPRHVWAAWRQGRRAVDLASVPYEALLAEPLEQVRRDLGLLPPQQAHRGAVPRSTSSALSRRAGSGAQSDAAAA